jgi:hypothetical protein
MNFKFFSIIFTIITLNSIINGSAAPATALKTCNKTKSWRLDGRMFPRDFTDGNKLKFVAFLQSSCPFCRTQAKKYYSINSSSTKSD